MLEYARRSTLDIKTISVRRTLYLSLVRSQLCYGSQVWAPQTINLIKRIERVQRRATKYVLDVPFLYNVSYNQRLDMLDLIPICYWHEFLDMVFYFKCINGITVINNELLPIIQNRERATRSADPNCLMFKTNKCKTTNYQKSFLTRSTRAWNTLPKDVRYKNITLNVFKNELLKYYKHALKNIYNVEDPRTWKSICLCCNMPSNLSCPISCCS